MELRRRYRAKHVPKGERAPRKVSATHPTLACLNRTQLASPAAAALAGGVAALSGGVAGLPLAGGVAAAAVGGDFGVTGFATVVDLGSPELCTARAMWHGPPWASFLH